MRIRTKITGVFSLSFAAAGLILWFGLTAILDSVSTELMRRQAEGTALFLQHSLALRTVPERGLMELTKHVSDESGSFEVSKVLLIGEDLKVLAAYPATEEGTDYSSHADVVQTFQDRQLQSVREGKDIDVLTWFETAPGEPRVLELKLDFAKSTALLEQQYSRLETAALASALGFLILLLAALLWLISRTAIRPLLSLTRAMEEVGQGKLDIRLEESGRDEFTLLSRRFNEMVLSLREKIRLTSYVSRSTAEAVRDSLSSSGRPAAQLRSLTLFFSDIRGFTAYSETRDPSHVISLLNKILSLQSRIITGHKGDVDKFVGDEVMAVFSHSADAVEAALEIQSAMAQMTGELEGMAVGIGIHTGEVLQGDVGWDEMKDFTVIGDPVNTAARLESQAGPGEILISETVLQEVRKAGSWTGTLRGELALKGKAQKVRTYQLTGKKSG